MEGNESITQCSICLEDMVGRTPRALACLHTFCHSCLEDLYRSSVACPDYFSQESFQTRTGIECPVCRKRTPIPSGGIKGLPVNFLINQIKDAQASPSSPRGASSLSKPQCHNCPSEVPVVLCEVCESELCDACHKQHNKIPAFKGHQVQKLKKPAEICKSHNKEAKFICSVCCMQICMKCALSPDHRGHSEKIQEFEDWLEDAKSRISSSREQVAPHWLKLKQSHNVAQDYRKNLMLNVKQVNEAADSAIEKIKEQKEQMLKAFTDRIQHSSAVGIYLRTLYNDADNFMQSTIHTHGSDANNVMRLMSLSNLAASVMQDVKTCPSVESLDKITFVKHPVSAVSIGQLKAQKK